MSDKLKEKIFEKIQSFLEDLPVVIWGSGATIPFGLPTMGDLNNALKKKIDSFNPGNVNLEVELGKSEYEDQLPEIKKIIWQTVNDADAKVRQKLVDNGADRFDGVRKMIEKFRNTHPKIVNIITTNYDRVLESVMGLYGIPYSDGLGDHEFNEFNSTHFANKEIVNLIKVHGSLSWFQVGNNIRRLMTQYKKTEPVIICPGINKYQEAFKGPYRDLIQKSDDLIKSASSFLVVGFGFNDEHLTPKIKEKIEDGFPLVLITKKITPSCHNELKNAQKYIFLEEDNKQGKTLISMKKEKSNSVEENSIVGDYWQLEKFMEII